MYDINSHFQFALVILEPLFINSHYIETVEDKFGYLT